MTTVLVLLIVSVLLSAGALGLSIWSFLLLRVRLHRIQTGSLYGPHGPVR